MASIQVVARDLTAEELAQIVAGFAEHSAKHGNPDVEAERFGFVALDGERFVGCSSGLAYRRGSEYENWFFLTDLFVETDYRKRRIGSKLLLQIEAAVVSRGIGNIWTWTAEYEAPDFYRRQGYEVFCEMENWYPSGHSRIGVRKSLSAVREA